MPPKNLRTSKEFKSILVKNILRSIHVLARDLTSLFPAVISYSYISTTLNIADANSKFHPEPFSVLNSSVWREGHDWFLDQNYPPPEDTYLTVTAGNPHWTPPSSSCRTCCAAVCKYQTCSLVCSCKKCTWDDIGLKDSFFQK